MNWARWKCPGKCHRWSVGDDTMGHPAVRNRQPAVECRLCLSDKQQGQRQWFPVTYNNKAKLKALYVKQTFEEETDTEHGLSTRQIIDRLQQLGIKAERKSIYRDIEMLMGFGCDIRTYQRTLLDRRIHVLGRIRTKSEGVFADVDAIHEAMKLHRKVECAYYRRERRREALCDPGGQAARRDARWGRLRGRFLLPDRLGRRPRQHGRVPPRPHGHGKGVR